MKRAIRLMDNQVCEVKDAGGRVLLRVRIVPSDDPRDGPTVQIGMVSGGGRRAAGYDWSDRIAAELAAAHD